MDGVGGRPKAKHDPIRPQRRRRRRRVFRAHVSVKEGGCVCLAWLGFLVPFCKVVHAVTHARPHTPPTTGTSQVPMPVG